MKKIIFLFLLFVILVAGFTAYYFAVRPSDSSYTSATQQMKAMDESVKTFTSTVGNINHSSDVTDDVVSQLQKNISIYDDNLKSFSQNDLVFRDAKVKAIYDQSKTNFGNFSKSARSLVDSLQRYRTILTKCTSLVSNFSKITTVKEFDAADEPCATALKTANSASYEPFNNQFLKSYVVKANALLDAYRQVIVKSEEKAASISLTGITAARANISVVSQNTLDLTIASDPSTNIHGLENTITSQSTQIIR